MNLNIILLTVLMSLVTVGAQLLLKKGLSGLDPAIGNFSQLMHYIWSALGNIHILLSLALQAAGFGLWIYLVSNAKLALVSTVSSALFYIILSIASYFLFGESLNWRQWVGITLVAVGVYLIISKI